MKILTQLFAAFGVTSLIVGGASAAMLEADPTSYDRITGERQNAGLIGYSVDSGSSLIGVTGSNGSRTYSNVVIGFDLPDLAPGQEITAATLTFRIAAAREAAAPLQDLDTYLLGDSDPTDNGAADFVQTPTDDDPSNIFVGTLTESELAGGGDVGNDTFPDTDLNSFVSYDLSPAALATLISFYGGDETPDQAEAYFRWNLDGPEGDFSLNRYVLDVAGDDTPLLTITTIPEPASLALLVLGGLCLMPRRSRR